VKTFSPVLTSEDALAGHLIQDRGRRSRRVQRAGSAGDGDPDGQVAQVTPGAGQAGGFVADQEQDGPGEVGVEDVDLTVLVGARQHDRAAPGALGAHPGGHLAV
jgi:hypothetical protein